MKKYDWFLIVDLVLPSGSLAMTVELRSTPFLSSLDHSFNVFLYFGEVGFDRNEKERIFKICLFPFTWESS